MDLNFTFPPQTTAFYSQSFISHRVLVAVASRIFKSLFIVTSISNFGFHDWQTEWLTKIQRNRSFIHKRLLGSNQLKPYNSDKLWRSNNNSNTLHVHVYPFAVAFRGELPYMRQFHQDVSKTRMHVSWNIHGGCIFPQSCSVLPYGNFFENSSMRAVAKILRAGASEHSSNFCEQFEQRPNFASSFKFCETIRYP